jgi:hypothetical protein
MNRPLYVPGYDQTQSGEPLDKTAARTSPLASPIGGNSETGDDPPVCKRIQDLDDPVL